MAYQFSLLNQVNVEDNGQIYRDIHITPILYRYIVRYMTGVTHTMDLDVA